MNALPCTIYISFAGALAALVAGTRSAGTARWIALITAATAWAVTLLAATHFVPGPGLQALVDHPWIPQLGIRYHFAVDGISLTLLVLTGSGTAALPAVAQVTALGVLAIALETTLPSMPTRLTV